MALLKPPEEKTVVQRYLPTIDWLPKYNRTERVRSDLPAALTVWALLVPEAIAYAGIAGVSPEVGLDQRGRRTWFATPPKADSRGGRT